ncbi:SusC/RagA family TonB-linked outer membrane protein [Chryseobacterium sp. c4a]|uniref:SusC/RagA family TonB-linked outer membrane protein n=1 Tax=Chryseobacterium sp. c4a TaxID=1573582 RepID=UPI00135C8444|nr:SusC/RagA family TonB-linked outer membrane protein [Chryseobacterium sp. c4a]
MKNLCTAALFFIFSGHGVKAQQSLSAMRVSYQTEKMSAPDAIEKFISQTKIRHFSYSKKTLSGYFVQPTKCTDEPLMKCLDKLLKGLPFEGLIYNNMLIVRRKKNDSVSDLQETVPSNVAVADTLNPSSSVNKIDEIIVNAGYYTVKDKERTGSISKVTAKDIENQPVNNVLSTVQGRMAGVNIVQNSGVPGSGFEIQIRGKNSLRREGNAPLYIIDGVPVGGEVNTFSNTGTILPAGSISPLNSINPNDIESFEVLKDADATAIYGSRGANGVILITTKKGRSGKLDVSFNTSYGISHAVSNLKMMNTQQYMNMRRQAFSNSGVSTYPATAYDINGTWHQNRTTDWRKTLIGKTATSSATQLSVSGGSETTTFALSFGHNEQTTVFGRDFNYKTNTLSSNITHRSKDNRFQFSFSNIFALLKNNVLNSDVTRTSFSLSPNAPALYNTDGSLNWENNTWNNPVAAYNATYSNENIQYLSNMNIGYEIFQNIRLKLNSGINYQAFEEWSIRPNTIFNPAYITGQSSAYSSASKNNQNRFSYLIEPQINWAFQKKEHSFDLLIGGTFQSEINSTGSMTGTGFESNVFIRNIAAAQTKTINDQISKEYRYAAVFGRINYQFAKKYILNITGRRDGSSRFGPNKKFANFGAVGGAWLFTKEHFLNDLKWLNFGKLRGSFGIAGSDNIGDYQYMDTYTVSSSIYNGVTGVAPSRLFNPDFSWEKTTKLETALELGLFKNKLNLTAAWYRNRSSNQLVGYQLPAITGFPSVLANLNATVQNSGWEFEINVKPLSKDVFQWNTGFNISFPKNKLLSFPGLQGSTYGNTYVIGQPISIVKLYQLEGINPQTGMYQFTDFNGDGKISSPDDNQVIENIGVRYFGGWTNSLRYKDWALSFLFQFSKQKNRNYNYIIPSPGIMNNLPVEALNVWSPDNPDGLYQPYKPNAMPNHSQFQNSTATVSDASFIRLKNVELAYTIPIRESVFKSVRVYFQGQNLITWTKYFGIDPEFQVIGFLPPLKTFSFGLQCNL